MDILNFLLTMAVFMLLFNGFIRLQTKRHLMAINRAEQADPEAAPRPSLRQAFSPSR